MEVAPNTILVKEGDMVRLYHVPINTLYNGIMDASTVEVLFIIQFFVRTDKSFLIYCKGFFVL